MKRPKGWDERYIEAYRKEYLGVKYCSPERAMFEAGADAYEKKIYEWGEETCSAHTPILNSIPVLRRHCDMCWQELLKEVE